MLFTQIAQNKRNTRWVLVGYGLLLIAITILFAQVSWQVALGFALFGSVMFGTFTTTRPAI